MIKKYLHILLKKFLNNIGYQIIKINNNRNNMEDGIKRCRNRDIEIKTVIDVGASNGCWTKLCMKYYQDSYYYLIEAQKAHEPSLNILKNKYSNIDYAIKAAGNRLGEIYFDDNDLFGGEASDKPFANNCIIVPISTIDYEVKKNNLKSPFLIKLDTHGFEIPILQGAEKALNESNLVIIEAYNFKIAENSIKFYELCVYMEKKGFYPIDIIDLSLRPKDFSLWQMDIFFIRKDRPEFSSNSYV